MRIWTLTLVEEVKEGNRIYTDNFLTIVFKKQSEAIEAFNREKEQYGLGSQQENVCFFECQYGSRFVKIGLEEHSL